MIVARIAVPGILLVIGIGTLHGNKHEEMGVIMFLI